MPPLTAYTDKHPGPDHRTKLHHHGSEETELALQTSMSVLQVHQLDAIQPEYFVHGMKYSRGGFILPAQYPQAVA